MKKINLLISVLTLFFVSNSAIASNSKSDVERELAQLVGSYTTQVTDGSIWSIKLVDGISYSDVIVEYIMSDGCTESIRSSISHRSTTSKDGIFIINGVKTYSPECSKQTPVASQVILYKKRMVIEASNVYIETNLNSDGVMETSLNHKSISGDGYANIFNLAPLN